MRRSKVVSQLALVALTLMFVSFTTTTFADDGRSRHLIELATPTGIGADPSSTSINVHFNQVSNYSYYTIRLYLGNGKRSIASMNTPHSGTTFSGLSATTTYKITVQAIGNGTTYSNSDESRKVSVTTAAGALSCANGGTCVVGDRGPGNGIVFYVSPTAFSSPGSTCNTNGLNGASTCRYLEAAPAGWSNTGGAYAPADDPNFQWSNVSNLTGQDISAASAPQGGISGEQANWAIGQGFHNTGLMNVGGISTARAAVLAYAGTDSSSGQWYLPSMNELNELCKYSLGETTGTLSTPCATGGTLKTGTANDLGGFVASSYYSSSEGGTGSAWYFDFYGSIQTWNYSKLNGFHVRPIRTF